MPILPITSIGHFKFTKGPMALQHEFKKKKYFEFYASFQTITHNVFFNFDWTYFILLDLCLKMNVFIGMYSSDRGHSQCQCRNCYIFAFLDLLLMCCNNPTILNGGGCWAPLYIVQKSCNKGKGDIYWDCGFLGRNIRSCGRIFCLF